MVSNYDALIVVSFGGPEKTEDVLPFLENVVRGRNVPRQRLLKVAQHYYDLGGKSPINDQARDLVRAIEKSFQSQKIGMKVYWGNRNWHPFLAETVAKMKREGVSRALAFATSAYSSYSSCRQYLEDIENARRDADALGLEIRKLRPFFNHPGFVRSISDLTGSRLDEISSERREKATLLFTAHSIPVSMAKRCDYQQQLEEVARLVSQRLEHSQWQLVFQSRSGPAHLPWLEPDICDALRTLAGQGKRDVVVSPIGFLSDHVEVLHDLDTEAREVAEELGMNFLRVPTVGTKTSFIQTVVDLVKEQLQPDATTAEAIGRFPARSDNCRADCCART